MEYIGVLSGISKVVYPSPKRESLIFDKIAFLGLQEYIDWLRYQTHPEYEIADEFDWLKNEGIFFEPYFGENPESESPEYLETMTSASKAINNYLHMLTNEPQSKRYQSLDKAMFKQLEIAGYHARAASILLRENGYAATPLWDTFNKKPRENNIDVRKTNILQIVMNKIPIPEENTPWEAILDFKKNPKSVGALLGLRNWVNNVARGDLEISEIETNLDYLLYEYKEALKLHKIKYNRGTIETLVVTSAEILENLIKVKWGDLAKNLFSIGNRKIDLLEAELSMPGREVSFIIRAQEQFGDT